MRPWSPELELVVRLSRLQPSRDDTARALTLASAPLDWDRVLALAIHHGVVPLVDENVSRLSITSVPEAFRRRLRQARLASVTSDLVLYHAWLELCRAFETRGIAAMTLKGFHVVLSVYGEVGRRPVGDVDLLVHRRDVPAALELLDQVGYSLTDTWQAARLHVGLDHILAAAHEMTLGSARRIAVDLHWEAEPHRYAPPADELLASAEWLGVEGQDVRVAPPGVAVALLVLHGHRSAWSRLRWLVDVAEAIERLTPAEFERTTRVLDGLGMAPALANALRLIESAWGELPLPARDLPLPDGARTWVLRHHRRMMEREQDWPTARDLWRPGLMLQDRVARAPSLVAAVTSALRPGRFEWAAVRLPGPLRAGYYLLRPLGILRQALAKVMRNVPMPDEPAQGQPAPAAGAAFIAHTPAVTTTPRSEARATVPLTFVSAIYNSDMSSLLGGRGRDISFYLPSLINIANLGAPIVIYCSPNDVAAVERAIAPHFRGYRVIPFKLSQFEHFERFLEWKRTYRENLKINDRNEVLCFLKSYWVQQAIADDPFGHDRYFWIDAGLTHHGIFPERVGGVELRIRHPAAHYYPDNPANIFTPELGAALAGAVTPGRVFFCALPFGEGERRHTYERVVAAKYGRRHDEVHIEDHLVGGLFGGHREALQAVHRVYAELLAEFIATRTYTLEEQVFSSVNALHPDLFSLRRFETWWFHSPGERTSRLDAEGNSFYRIFTSLVPHDTPV